MTDGPPASPIGLHGPYRPRRFLPLGVLELDGWRLKSTAITHADRTFSPRFAEAAGAAARAALPHPAVTATRYGLGFLGVHQGRTADVAFVDWWMDEDELHHVMFVTGADGGLRPARPGELTACSWDLALIAFERDAWVRTVLADPAGPDAEAYLRTRLSGGV